MTARNVICPGFGGVAPLMPADEPFDREIEGPPPPPPPAETVAEDHGGGGPPPPRDDDEAPDFGPVVPLGVTTKRGQTAYALLDSGGLQCVYSPRDLVQPHILESLFGRGARDMLIAGWPEAPRGKRKVAEHYDAMRVGVALMDACRDAGHADGVRLRRDGVWPLGDGLLFHAGDRVLLPDGVAARAGWRDGRNVYIYTQEKRARPAPEAATPGEVAALEKALGLWTFASPVAPRVLMGLVCCGMLGAALPWRPHVFLRGVMGAGKSSLARLVSEACGAGEPSTDITAAGLNRHFDARSGLIPLDEKEANASGVERIVEIMRGASDGQGAERIITAIDGGAMSLRVAGCFLFAATTLPSMTEADASRITLLHVKRGTVDRRAEVDQAIALARSLHPALLRRVLEGWDRYRANWHVARQAAAGRDATSRSADQVGALLAGWATLTRDAPMALAEAKREIAAFEEFIQARAAAEDFGTGQLVLQHLLGTRVAVTERSSDAMTVQGALIAAMREQWKVLVTESDIGAKEAARGRAAMWDKRLGSVGLRALFDASRLQSWPCEGPPRPGLLIGQSHPAMANAFHGSSWPGQAWRSPLHDLPGVVVSKGPMKFPTGGAHRAIFVPLSALGIDDNDLAGPE